MPINLDHVLTDQARVHHKTKGARVEFETQLYTVVSDWFRCRVTIPEGSEKYLIPRTELYKTYQFICYPTYPDGTPILISQEDEIEIQQGNAAQYAGFGQSEFYVVTGAVRKPRNLEEELLYHVFLQRKEEL